MLKDRKLRMLGARVTQWRQNFTEAAEKQEMGTASEKDDANEAVKRLGKKVRSRGTRRGDLEPLPSASAFATSTPIDSRKRTRCRRRLSLQEKITIISQALCLKYAQKDIAREHRVSVSAVSGLIFKARRNPNFMVELIAERDRKLEARSKIAEVVTEMNKRDEFIDSVAHVKKELQKEKAMRQD